MKNPKKIGRRRKTSQQQIMEAPNENLEVIQSLAKKSCQDHMSSTHAAFVGDLLGGYVQEKIDMNEDINPVSMHRCLTQAVAMQKQHFTKIPMQSMYDKD